MDEQFLDTVEIPQIPKEQQSFLDSEILLTEISEAVKNMKNGKCPGTDGLPVEFYKIFWPKNRYIYEKFIS